jgi:hypothetical protein
MEPDAIVQIFRQMKDLAELKSFLEKLRQANPKLYNQFAHFVSLWKTYYQE